MGEEEEIYSNELYATNLNYTLFEDIDKPMNIKAKIRYNAKEAEATLYPIEKDKVKIEFKEPQRAITKGQSVVFYVENILIRWWKNYIKKYVLNWAKGLTKKHTQLDIRGGKQMKNQNGITLASLAVYIIVIFVVLTTLLTITAYFKSNLNHMDKDATKFAEFDKFNLYFLEEVKKTDNEIVISEGNENLEGENGSNYIEFKTGNKYEYDLGSKKIYLIDNTKTIAISSNIENCNFKIYKETEKTIIEVNLTIAGENKIVEYVLGYENKYSNYEDEEIYTKNEPSITANWDLTKVTIYKDLNGEIVPIPTGYVASKATGEKTIQDGLVIYQGIEEVTDDNVETAKTTRNQFVWIPVNNPNEMYGIDENGNKLGKLYNFDTNGNATALNWTETDGIMSWTNDSLNREPANLDTIYDNSTNIIDWSEDLYQMEFSNMIDSVERYKGFYIGRYETGGFNTDIIVIRAGEGDYSINRIDGYITYNKTKLLSSNFASVSVAWGSQWCQIMKFVNKKTDGSGTVFNVAISSTLRHTGNLSNTGENLNDKVQNIYDLEGNVLERIAVAKGNNTRVFYGGSYNTISSMKSYYYYSITSQYPTVRF